MLTLDKISFVLEDVGCLYTQLAFGGDDSRLLQSETLTPDLPAEARRASVAQAEADMRDAMIEASCVCHILATAGMLYGNPLGGFEYLLRFWGYSTTTDM